MARILFLLASTAPDYLPGPNPGAWEAEAQICPVLAEDLLASYPSLPASVPEIPERGLYFVGVRKPWRTLRGDSTDQIPQRRKCSLSLVAWMSHGKKDLGMKRVAAGDLGDGPPWEAGGGFGGPQASPSATLWCHAAPISPEHPGR